MDISWRGVQQAGGVCWPCSGAEGATVAEAEWGGGETIQREEVREAVGLSDIEPCRTL